MCAARTNLEDNHQQKKLPTERVGVNPGQDIGIKIPLKRKYHCCEPGCGRGYFKKGDLANHVKKFHADYFKFFCDKPGCGRGFPKKSILFSHKRRVHVTDNLKCQDSAFSALFQRSQTCRSHMWVKHGIGKGPKCDQCGKREPSVEYLRGHERAVHGAPKLLCREPGCARVFNYNTDMFKHIRIKHR